VASPVGEPVDAIVASKPSHSDEPPAIESVQHVEEPRSHWAKRTRDPTEMRAVKQMWCLAVQPKHGYPNLGPG
jgi:hypothetical protein